MSTAVIVIVIVVGLLVGIIMGLRSSAKPGMPRQDVLDRAAQRAAGTLKLLFVFTLVELLRLAGEELDDSSC